MKIINRWYVILCFVLVYWQISIAIKKYPGKVSTIQDQKKTVKTQEGLLKNLTESETRISYWAGKKNKESYNSPFQKRKKKVRTGKKIIKKKVPPRRYRLSGIAGGTTAIMINNQGEKVFVAVGDLIDSAKVLKISPTHVTLKDKGGKFEIPMEK